MGGSTHLTPAIPTLSFQKWQSCIQNFQSEARGAIVLENGVHITKCGPMTFVSCHFVKSRINETLNMGPFCRWTLQKLWAHAVFAEKLRLH